jgi:cytochrome b
MKTSTSIRVWDFPTRIFHWVLAACFAVAVITQDMERLRQVHITSGYTMMGLVMFRFMWGLLGTRYARFSSFLPAPRTVVRYLWSLVRGKPQHYVGHNPLGALGIVAMMMLTVGVVISGVLLEGGISENLLEDIHEGLANGMLAVVGIHLVGVVLSGVIHRENLVKAMLTGQKNGPTGEGIRHSFWWLGLLMLAAIGAFWVMQLSGP